MPFARVIWLISFAWSPTEILFSNLSSSSVNQNAGTSVGGEKKERKGRLLVALGFFPLIIQRVAVCLKGLADKFRSSQNPAGTRAQDLKAWISSRRTYSEESRTCQRNALKLKGGGGRWAERERDRDFATGRTITLCFNFQKKCTQNTRCHNFNNSGKGPLNISKQERIFWKETEKKGVPRWLFLYEQLWSAYRRLCLFQVNP